MAGAVGPGPVPGVPGGAPGTSGAGAGAGSGAHASDLVVADELVTGEAVVLDVRIAKLAGRGLAKAIDVLLQLAVLLGVLYLLLRQLQIDQALLGAYVVLFLVAVVVGYPTVSETLWRGRTLGKLALGLRVVRDDGGPIRFRQALFRALTGFVEIWATSGFLAVVTSFTNRHGKRLGDVYTGTITIGERVPRRRRRRAEVPPGLDRWTASLELSLLDDDLALAARQYLDRATDFSPDTARDLGLRLAAQISARVTPPPPPGLTPYGYLSAVLAERGRREVLRLQAGVRR